MGGLRDERSVWASCTTHVIYSRSIDSKKKIYVNTGTNTMPPYIQYQFFYYSFSFKCGRKAENQIRPGAFVPH